MSANFSMLPQQDPDSEIGEHRPPVGDFEIGEPVESESKASGTSEMRAVQNNDANVSSNTDSEGVIPKDSEGLSNARSKPDSSSFRINNARSSLRSNTPSPSVAQLKLDEKIALLSGKSMWLSAGVSRLKVPSIQLCDGPHGVRKPIKDMSLQRAYASTCFPTAAALACSWDPKVVHNVGRALRTECIHHKVHVLLGPGMNLKRHPCGGRNFEYFSEDPFLTGTLATAYIQGVQGSGQVAACAKHFCVNNQESHRFVVNAVVDERTLRELYLRHFEMVVKEAKPLTMMCAYNKVNGKYCSEHMDIAKILREEWGYDGVLMSDWGAVNDRVLGIRSQLDLEMPGSHGVHNREIRTAMGSNHLTEAEIDTCAQRVLTLIDSFMAGDADDDAASTNSEQSCSWPVQHDIAKQTAIECAVLLQNKDNFLPLNPKDVGSVAVIGQFGRNDPRYQGMGSSHVHAEWVRATYDEIFRFCDKLDFAPGYDVDDENVDDVDEELLQTAIRVAQTADVVFLCVGLPEIMESEGFDRTHMKMPAQHVTLITEICKVNPNVVVILSNGASVEMPWVDAPKAIFESFLLGEAGGAAIVDIIFGVQSPSGKLAETIPLQMSDVLADKYFPGTRDTVEHREGLDVGYRYFDSANQPVRFPFGHGLSYTTFEYNELDVNIIRDEYMKKQIEVCLDVTNTGEVAAKEIVQCYIHQLDPSVYRPFQELKAFEKVFLQPGQTKRVKLVLLFDAFSFYDIGASAWIVEPSEFEIRIGSSSRDIRLTETIEFTTGQVASDEAVMSYPPKKYDASSRIQDVEDETFYRRFGPNYGRQRAAAILAAASEGRQFDRNSLLKEVAATSTIGKYLQWIVLKGACADLKPGPSMKRDKKLLELAVANLPLRTMALFAGGHLSFELLDAMIASMNGSLYTSFELFIVALTPFRTKVQSSQLTGRGNGYI